MYKTQKAFTLVELIVVITILAILGTISFISLQGYSKTARDSIRISDISNIKTSLELFILNTGYYPTPDHGSEVDYEGELLWTQGTVGDTVTRNLSRNLIQKPTDPLYDFEYVYSITNSKKEYEVMSVYERGFSNKNLISNTHADSTYDVKVEGTYNGIFVKTPGYIVPLPSIITSEDLISGLALDGTNIDSMVVTNGKNIPTLSIPNTKTSTGGLDIHLSVYTGSITADSEDPEKILAMTKIQGAYTGTELENDTIYKTILENTTDEELIAIIDDVVLNKTPAPTIVSDNEAPVGGDFSIPSTTSTTNITLTITCPAEDPVEMYVSGDITNSLSWEACSSSKNVELESGEGNKNVSVIWRDSGGNESDLINKNITLNTSVSGECGTDDGRDLYSIPVSLCLAGNPTSVSDNGSTYNWSCEGINMGTDTNCEANHLLLTVVALEASAGFYGSNSGNYNNVTLNFNGSISSSSVVKACVSGCSCSGSAGSFSINSTGSMCLSSQARTHKLIFSTWPTSVTISQVGNGVHNYGPYLAWVYNNGSKVSAINSCNNVLNFFYTNWNESTTCSLKTP